MRIKPFEYHAAESLSDALEFLGRHGTETKMVAGGTDLVLAMKEKRVLPQRVMSLHRLSELDFVRAENGTVRVGSLSRLADLEAHDALREAASGLCTAVGSIGSWQIRNVATIGGNLCTASPAADSAPALLALDARAVLVDTTGEVEMPLGDFFRGPGETALSPSQALKEVVFQRPSPNASGCYLKLMRKKAVDLATVGVAFQAERAPDTDKLVRVAIALGGVAPIPIRVPEAEAVLTGLTGREALQAVPDAARKAAGAARPISDVRASADYRRAMVEVYVERAAREAIRSLVDR